MASGPQAAIDAVCVAIWSYTQGDDLTGQLRTVLARADRAGIERLSVGVPADEVTKVANIALQVWDGGGLNRPDQ